MKTFKEHKANFTQHVIFVRSDPFFIWSLRISLFLFALCIFLTLFFWKRLPPQIPLYYSLPWGDDQLGTPIALLGFLGGCLSMYLGSICGAALLLRKVSYFAHMLLTMTTIIVFLGLIGIVQIILVVT